ncbi:hypothetical protein KI387_026731, partial [Taxus chinensis]
IQTPHRGIEIRDDSNVSHEEDVNEHRPGKEINSEYSRNWNENQYWGSDEMLNGESAIWINMEGNWHCETNFKEHEGSGIYKKGPKNQEAHMESLLPSTQII